ncbi:MAG: hypothetical protein WD469_03560 [Paenibacillaceae bacterium]
MNLNQSFLLYTTAGREQIHKKLRPDIRQEILSLMESSIPNQSVEYIDNRMSRYSMMMGKCEITGMYLFASDVYCHHYIPLYLGGSNKFNNMRILQKETYELIHHTHKETIEVLMNRLGITDLMKIKINQYREKYGLKLV